MFINSLDSSKRKWTDAIQWFLVLTLILFIGSCSSSNAMVERYPGSRMSYKTLSIDSIKRYGIGVAAFLTETIDSPEPIPNSQFAKILEGRLQLHKFNLLRNKDLMFRLNKRSNRLDNYENYIVNPIKYMKKYRIPDEIKKNPRFLVMAYLSHNMVQRYRLEQRSEVLWVTRRTVKAYFTVHDLWQGSRSLRIPIIRSDTHSFKPRKKKQWVFPPAPSMKKMIDKLSEQFALELSSIPKRSTIQTRIIKSIKTHKVNLSHKGLKYFPYEIMAYRDRIYELNLTGNKIHSLSPDIGQLKNLKKLSLNRNEFNQYPEELNQIKKLRYLDLSRNPITHIPSSIKKLKRLRFLKLKGIKLGDQNKSLLQTYLPRCQIVF